MLSRRFLAVAALTLGLALSGCGKGVRAPGAAAGPAPSVEDMSLGDPAAKVKVIEYASASCSHCARFNNEVFPAFKAKYIDTGRVQYTLKEFLTPPVEVAAAGFLLARCTGKDRYFSTLDAVYKGQDAMFQSGDFHGGLLAIAKAQGLSEAQFTACLSDKAAAQALSARADKHARDDKISSTPTFIVNGKNIGAGEMTLVQLDAAIAEAAK